MSGLNAGHVGIAGEVRCIVKREDGSVKEDTGFQKNLILNQGLDFFGGGKGDSVFQVCAIGSGNSSPVATQTQLGSFLALTSGAQSSNKYDYAPDSSNTYKINRVFKYVFTGLNNANVTEVGLASRGTTSSDYYLCTRALLKDTIGEPTTITVLAGETLDVYYKLWLVINTLDSSYTVNMLDAKGGVVPYNVISRPAYVGKSDWYECVGKVLTKNNYTGVSVAEDLPITAGIGSPNINSTAVAAASLRTYAPGSYKNILDLVIPVGQGNTGIRSIELSRAGAGDNNNGLGIFKIRFGSVANDSPIPKTNLQTLSIPIEFSWGRYEGVL